MSPFLYIHNPPPSFGLEAMRRNPGDTSYAAEAIFINRALTDSSIRTFDLQKASLFYVPTLAYHRFRYACTRPRFPRRPKWVFAVPDLRCEISIRVPSLCSNLIFQKAHKHISDLVNSMQRSDGAFRQSWRQRNASRHVFFFTTDKGACTTLRGAEQPVYISHWGLQVPWFEQLAPARWKANASDPHPHTRACADGRDIIVPPLIPQFPLNKEWAADKAREAAAIARAAAKARAAAALVANASLPSGGAAPSALHYNQPLVPPPPPPPSPPPPVWRCLLFFAGTTERTGGSNCPTYGADGLPAAAKCYSQGVRQALFRHHRNRSRFCVSEHMPDWAERSIWRQSRFCLAPNGEGFGNRLSLAMEAGCVPVIIQPAVLQPFEELLPYDNFSLRLSLDDVPQLPTLLEAVTDEQHAALRRGVRLHAAAFGWDAASGAAYDHLRYALCLRATHADALDAQACYHLRPASLPRVQVSHGGFRGWVGT